MNKKIITLALVLIVLASAFVIVSQASVGATSGTISLNIYMSPSSVLADNSTYNCIFVQLQDSNGYPCRAEQNTIISLTSSLTNIGTVDSQIIIPKGTTYSSGNFFATFTPGSTTITASATGYETVTSTMVTKGPVSNALAVYGIPSTLPADGGTYAAIMVQLQDSSNGHPARAPNGGVQVTLSSSNVNVGTIDQFVTIPGGQTYAIASINTTTTAGSVDITAVAPNYPLIKTTITTKSIGGTPTQFRVYGPTVVTADNYAYKLIAIQLQDAGGNIATSSSDLTVNIFSSNLGVGSIDSQITIPQSQTYALATLNTSFLPGTTTITAVATNLISGQASITTTGFTPSKLAIYCVPSKLPSDDSTYQAIQVQLQDSQGQPAKDPKGNVNVNLFSSQPTVGNVSSILTIPFGQTQATGAFTTTNNPGQTTITAQASDYSTGQSRMATYLIDYAPLQMTISANQTNVNNGYTISILAYATANGGPVTGATVTFTSNNGGTFAATTEQGNGYYNTSFTAPNFAQATTCTITASVSKTGYLNGQATTPITVMPAPAPTATSSPTPTSAPTSNGDSGVLTFLIQDSQGNPLSNALVSSTIQPQGINSLLELSNSTGYVTFNNLTAGTYNFKTIKDGYPQTNETINFDGDPLTLRITLSDNILTGNASGNTLIIIVVVIIAAASIAVVSFMLLLRRKKSSNIRNLQELQKQMKNRYETPKKT
jgi:hypothetical protein